MECELKGLKLFVKRGEKGFTGGMPGHIKLLSKKNSQKSEERLREFFFMHHTSTYF